MSDWNGDNMNNGLLQPKTIIELNDNNARKRYNPDITYYDIMHGERKVAEINMRGEAAILDEKFIPYDLYLENDCDFDTLINNMNNFYHWCAFAGVVFGQEICKRNFKQYRNGTGNDGSGSC